MADLHDWQDTQEFSLCNDRWISQQAQQHDMIKPFVGDLRRTDDTGTKIISYGASSYGYDIRLNPTEFYTFHHIPGQMVDPKDFDPEFLRSVRLQNYGNGRFFVLPAHSYGLGVSLERIKMPKDTTAVCMGKSTYARCGIIVNVTPLEAEWEGHITLEFSNSSSADAKIYASEGVAQLLFYRGAQCSVTYAQRKGKYQGQTENVVLPLV